MQHGLLVLGVEIMRSLHYLHESLGEVLELKWLLSFLIKAGSRIQKLSFGFLKVVWVIRNITLALYRIACDLFFA